MKSYLFSANGVTFIVACGDAPGWYEGALSALNTSVKIGVYPWLSSCF